MINKFYMEQPKINETKILLKHLILNWKSNWRKNTLWIKTVKVNKYGKMMIVIILKAFCLDVRAFKITDPRMNLQDTFF